MYGNMEKVHLQYYNILQGVFTYKIKINVFLPEMLCAVVFCSRKEQTLVIFRVLHWMFT